MTNPESNDERDALQRIVNLENNTHEASRWELACIIAKTALVQQHQEPREMENCIAGRIYIPVICQNGHKAIASYRWDKERMEFVFEGVPESEKCNCPKSSLGDGYKANGFPAMFKAAPQPTPTEVKQTGGDVERVAAALEPWLPQPEYFDKRNVEIMQENRLGAAKAAIAARKRTEGKSEGWTKKEMVEWMLEFVPRGKTIPFDQLALYSTQPEPESRMTEAQPNLEEIAVIFEEAYDAKAKSVGAKEFSWPTAVHEGLRALSKAGYLKGEK